MNQPDHELMEKMRKNILKEKQIKDQFLQFDESSDLDSDSMKFEDKDESIQQPKINNLVNEKKVIINEDGDYKT